MNNDATSKVADEWTGLTALEVIQRSGKLWPAGLVMATSLGLEDQVLTQMICASGTAVRFITLDTGRLFPEFYDLLALTESRYGIRIEVFCPDATHVESMVAERGVNLFRRSVEDRKRCCRVRKLLPLARALAGASAWICGLRREQSETRSTVSALAWDDAHGLPKICPLVDWTWEQVKAYAEANEVPSNPLHQSGFLSIGCACCTRAVHPGECLRAGRWWWEEAEHKECGLHWVDGKIVRPTPPKP